MPHLSVVIPRFNAALTLTSLYRELSALEIVGGLELMAAMRLLSGTQLVLLGIMGEYVGRIYFGVSDKPQSVIRATLRSSEKAGVSP